MARLVFGLLFLILGLGAAFLLWLDSTGLEADYINFFGFKVDLLPAGITLAVLAALAALAALTWRRRPRRSN